MSINIIPHNPEKYQEGITAFYEGATLFNNPYDPEYQVTFSHNWEKGWNRGKFEEEEKEDMKSDDYLWGNVYEDIGFVG